MLLKVHVGRRRWFMDCQPWSREIRKIRSPGRFVPYMLSVLHVDYARACLTEHNRLLPRCATHFARSWDQVSRRLVTCPLFIVVSQEYRPCSIRRWGLWIFSRRSPSMGERRRNSKGDFLTRGINGRKQFCGWLERREYCLVVGTSAWETSQDEVFSNWKWIGRSLRW